MPNCGSATNDGCRATRKKASLESERGDCPTPGKGQPDKPHDPIHLLLGLPNCEQISPARESRNLGGTLGKAAVKRESAPRWRIIPGPSRRNPIRPAKWKGNWKRCPELLARPDASAGLAPGTAAPDVRCQGVRRHRHAVVLAHSRTVRANQEKIEHVRRGFIRAFVRHVVKRQ